MKESKVLTRTSENSGIVKIQDTISNCKDDTKLSRFIFSTDKDVDILMSPELDDYTDFIFKNAEKFKNQILNLISCNNLTNSQKGLLLKLMNGLNYEQYISFINTCYDEYKKGNLSKFNFEHNVLFNNWRHRHYIIKYYNKDETLEIIKIIQKDNSLLDDKKLKNRIKKVVTGEYWDEVKKFYVGAGYNNPELLNGWQIAVLPPRQFPTMVLE